MEGDASTPRPGLICPFEKMRPSQLNRDDAFYMALALKDATAHAEMLAITQAEAAVGDWRLNECDLYVTKEPCPMCSGATIMSRLNRVVFAWGDPKMGCMGGATELHSLPKLNHRVSVTSGVLEEPCREILQAYFNMKRGRDSSAPA